MRGNLVSRGKLLPRLLLALFVAGVACSTPVLAQNQLSGAPSQDDTYPSPSDEGKDGSSSVNSPATETTETTAAPTFGNSGTGDAAREITLDIEYIILFDSDILVGADGT